MKAGICVLFGISFLCNAQLDPRQLAHELKVPLRISKKIIGTITHNSYLVEQSWGQYYDILPQFINDRDYKIGCEIGVAFGGHLESILKKTSVEKIYAFDPYIMFCDATKVWRIPKKHWGAWWDTLFYYVRDRLSQFGDRIEMIRKTATEGAIMIPDNSLDFIFIDGDHSYAAVCQDVSNYYDKVRSGGMIAGDDYNQEEVARAVNEFFAQRGLPVNQHPEQERFWWVEKP